MEHVVSINKIVAIENHATVKPSGMGFERLPMVLVLIDKTKVEVPGNWYYNEKPYVGGYFVKYTGDKTKFFSETAYAQYLSNVQQQLAQVQE